MDSYKALAASYDELTEDVAYEKRADFVEKLFLRAKRPVKSLLDLACGTGSLSFELEEYGYDIVAVDNSYEMLSVAAEKRGKLESDVLFLCQEMSELDLFGTIDATVCSLDSINHILDEQELLDVFKKVALFSNRGAVFVFDVNTVYKHRQVLGDNCFVYENGDTFCTWQNSLCDDGVTVDISLDFFDKVPEKGLYARYSTDFSERAYEIDELKNLLSQSGFEIKAVFDDDSFLPLRRDSQRAIIVAKKV